MLNHREWVEKGREWFESWETEKHEHKKEQQKHLHRTKQGMQPFKICALAYMTVCECMCGTTEKVSDRSYLQKG